MGYRTEERETILNYDPATEQWYVWTNIPAYINKFQKQGWKMIRSTIENGSIIDAEFIGEKRLVSIRDASKPKRTGRFEQKEAEHDKLSE